MFLASLLAGNVEWVPGTTSSSFYGTLFVSFVLIVIAGIFWISAAKLLRPSTTTYEARKHVYEDSTQSFKAGNRNGESKRPGYESRKRSYESRAYNSE
jgi:NADH:ubiquinone oxidoreductase subunit 3 (subunit A)